MSLVSGEAARMARRKSAPNCEFCAILIESELKGMGVSPCILKPQPLKVRQQITEKSTSSRVRPDSQRASARIGNGEALRVAELTGRLFIFLLSCYPTTLTSLPGTTIIRFGARPSRLRTTASWAAASCSIASFVASRATVRLPRSLPFTCKTSSS